MLLNESELVKIIKEELHAALAEQDQQEPAPTAVEEPPMAPAATLSDEEAAPLVVKMVRTHIGRFKQCYESRLKSKPEFQGKWELFIDINVNGQTENPKVSPAGDTLKDEEFEECLRREALRMKIDTKGKTLANPMTGLGPIPLVFVAKKPGLQEQEDSQVDSEAVDVIEDFEELDPEAKAQTRAALGYGVGE